MSYQSASYGGAPSGSWAPASGGYAMQQAPPSTPTAGNTSISQLVQALQKGDISKQQLYSSLTTMYKGGQQQQQQQSNAGLSASLLGSPMTANSSFDASFSLHQSAPPTPQQPLHQQFASTQLTPHQQPYQPQQLQHQPSQPSFHSLQQPQQYQQQQPPPSSHQPHPFPSFAAPQQPQPQSHAPPPAQPYSAQAQAAQQHIQSFLSKHLNNSNASLNLSLNQSDLDFTQPISRNTSLNFSSQQPSVNQSHSQYAPNQSTQPFFSPAHHAGDSYHDASSLQPMEHSQQQTRVNPLSQHHQQQPSYHQQQSQYQHQPHQQQSYREPPDETEAEEYLGGSASYFETASSTTSRSGNDTRRGSSRSVGGGGGGGARQSVRERMAQVYTDDVNRELTFKPAITPMPKGLYSKSAAANEEAHAAAPFLGRVMHWSENKRARERQRSVELERVALAECSFKPQLTAESIAIVEAPGSSHRRLFSARSTARAKILELEVRRKEEESFRANCTFEPSLNRKSIALVNAAPARKPLAAPASPAYGHPATSAAPAPVGISSSERDLAECTFAPRVNPVPERMVAASLYLEQNAFERLASTKPRLPSKSPRGKQQQSVEDGYASDGVAATARGSARGRNRTSSGPATARSASQGRDGSATRRRSSSQDARGVAAGAQPAGGEAGVATAGAPGEGGQQDSFNEFLARLKYKEFQRTERLAALRADEQRQHQYGRPMLSKKSAQIVKKSMESGRYQSPAKHASAVATARAASDAQEQQLVLAVNSSPAASASAARETALAAAHRDPECTFAPRISAYSSSLSRRTFHEMSALELVRRAHNLELAAAERQAAEMEEASFAPRLNKGRTAAVDSRLKVLSEPELYLERLEFQKKLREAENARVKQQRDEEEVKECTFMPAVHEAPEYVKAIARSMEQTKALEAQTSQPKRQSGKPDWK